MKQSDVSVEHQLRGMDAVRPRLGRRAAGTDEQLALRERIAAARLKPTPPIDRFWFTSVYFLEPGGVLFELATDGSGFDRDEEPGRLGERLILPPWLEGQRESIKQGLPALVLPDA